MADQLQAARDEIAEMCGYRFIVDREMGPVGWELHGGAFVGDHPIPASLDFVSLVWPDGWGYEVVRSSSWNTESGDVDNRVGHESHAFRFHSDGDWEIAAITICIDSSEVDCRMRCFAGLIKWLRDNDRPAFDAACEKIRKEIP